MRIGRWYEPSVQCLPGAEVIREVDVNETSGELGSAGICFCQTAPPCVG